MRFAICNEMFEGWGFDDICVEVARCGYEGIEIAPFTLDEDPSRISEQRAGQIARTAGEHGLQVTAFHWLLAKPAGLHLTTPDDAVRARTSEFLKHLVRLCAAMDGKYLVFGSPRQRDLLPGVIYEDAFDRAADIFSAVADFAGPLGVSLALEPLGPDETTFMVTTEQTVRLVEAVNHPACRLHLDVKAMATEDAGIVATIENNADHMDYFHANDANLRGPGFGDVDFVPIFAALKNIGYDGWVSVEVFDYSPDPQTIARKSIDYMRRSLAQT